jgi:hypothetical protein
MEGALSGAISGLRSMGKAQGEGNPHSAVQPSNPPRRQPESSAPSPHSAKAARHPLLHHRYTERPPVLNEFLRWPNMARLDHQLPTQNQKTLTGSNRLKLPSRLKW